MSDKKVEVKETPKKVIRRKKKVTAPAADMVINQSGADRWLDSGQWRVINVADSVRLDAEEFNPKRANRILELLLGALKEDGVLYAKASVPAMVVVKKSPAVTRKAELVSGINPGDPVYKTEDAGAGYVKITK